MDKSCEVVNKSCEDKCHRKTEALNTTFEQELLAKAVKKFF